MKASQNISALEHVALMVMVLFCLIQESMAQGGDLEASQLQITAAEYFETQDYLKALGLYKQLASQAPSDPVLNYRIGVCMYNLKEQRAGSGVYFEKAIWGMPQDMFMPLTVDPEVLESYYYLGQHYHLQEEFEIAIMMYQTYQNYKGIYVSRNPEAGTREHSLQEVNNLINKSVYAMEHINDISKALVENLGEGVNSEFPDYAPIISATGSKLIFTSRRKGTGGLTDPRGEYFEDIYVTLAGPDGWIPPTGISEKINTDLHDAGIGLSLNEADLMIYRTNKSLTGGDIYNSKLVQGEWSDPEIISSSSHLEEESEKGVNTSYIEPSACMNKERDVLIFSSNRPGGYGGMDLYRVVKLPDGAWSYAVNLGPTINTLYDEDAPYLSPDNSTLYFSSKGHRNMGGYDIFKTKLYSGSGRLRSDIGLLWSIPENLKAPINSIADDIYYVVAGNGRTAYFSSDREGGLGGADIYKADLPMSEGINIVIKGTVYSLDDRKPLQARLTVLELGSRKVKGEYYSNSETGRFVMILSPKIKYRMITEADGHYSVTEDYFLVSFQESLTILNKEIYMQPIITQIKSNDEYLFTYILEKVQFETKSHKILPGADSAFATLGRAMLANPKMIIEIAGHTDNKGGQASNLGLSQKRANEVRSYLISKGIDEIRLKAKGYGESAPLARNDTEEGRAMNRRTEIRVIEE